MTTFFNPGENQTESTFSTKRIYSEYPTVTSDQSQYRLSDFQLSQTLALIKYVGQCGYSEFDTIHVVLARLRASIVVLLRRCVHADRQEYSEFVYALLKSTDVVIEKLIIRALANCSKRVSLSSCHLIIREVYNLVRLVYSLTNPLNLPRILTEEYGLSSQHGLSVSSLRTNMLLDATHRFQKALVAYYDTLEADMSVESLVNMTPLRLYTSILVYTMDLTSKLMVTITTNAVPTHVTLLYYKDLLSQQDVPITDIEHFEAFISHFQKVDDLAAHHKNTPLYDVQKELIKPTFLEIIASFPVHPLLWCTPIQTLNYLQMFIDVYNKVYGEDLIIERVWSLTMNMESTVIKKERNMVPISNHQPLDPLPVPEFVSHFDGPDSGSWNMIFSPRAEKQQTDPDSCVTDGMPESGDIPRSALLEWAIDYVPTDKNYSRVFELNELVAQDVKATRAEYEKQIGYSKVWLRDPKCFRCKYFPWHRHKLPE